MEEALKRVRANSAGLSSEHNRSPPAADRSLGAAPAPPSAPAPAAESEDYEGRISAALTDSGRRLAFCNPVGSHPSPACYGYRRLDRTSQNARTAFRMHRQFISYSIG